MSTAPNSFFTWEDSYLLHNHIIDDQHRQIARLVDELYQSVMAHEPKEARIECLIRLSTFARAHFVTEEQLLRMHKYDRYLLHKAAHEGLAHGLQGLRQQVASGERELTLEYIELIKLWVVDHFNEFDRACEQFLSDANPAAKK